MPIYEYSCDNCRKVFEEWTRHIDCNLEQSCPECGGKARRIVSNTSFVLKGGGWYVTEYGNRKESSASAPGDAGGASAQPSGASEGGGVAGTAGASGASATASGSAGGSAAISAPSGGTASSPAGSAS